MTELLLLVAGLVLFGAGCIFACVMQNRKYKVQHGQTEEYKTDRIAELNSEIERSSRRG